MRRRTFMASIAAALGIGAIRPAQKLLPPAPTRAPEQVVLSNTVADWEELARQMARQGSRPDTIILNPVAYEKLRRLA